MKKKLELTFLRVVLQNAASGSSRKIKNDIRNELKKLGIQIKQRRSYFFRN